MNKQRKTSHILNIFQYDADGHVVIPASLTLGIAPAGDDNSAKVPSTAWVRTYVASIGGVLGTGTTNYVSKFTASGSIGNSLIFDNGTTVLIGTTTAPTPVMGVSFPFSVTSSAATRIRIDSTQATPNAGVGLYANGVQKFSFAMFGATSDFTIYNDALLAASILVKGNTNNILIGTSTDNSSKLRVNGTGWFDNTLTATSFVKNGGAATEILAADGSVITAGTGITISGGTISSTVTGGVTSFNTRTGAITLSSNDVTTALGFTPISSYTETDTLATVTSRGSSTTGAITISSGGDLNLRAISGSSDSGDIVFQDGSGAELHRLWGGSSTINYRTNAGTTYQLWHTGNLTNLNQLTNGPGYITGYTETDTLASVTGRGASTSTDITLNGFLTMGTSGTSYVRMGRYPSGVTNTGEAWIGRASDRNAGTMTVQLGGNSASSRTFEVVDYAWSVVLFQAGSDGNSYASSSFRAPIFYDSQNTGYYLDPASTSALAAVDMYSTSTLRQGSELRFYTSAGSLRGYIQATDTDDNHLIIATSGGEDIVFRDGGVSGTRNLVIRGSNVGTEIYGSTRSPIFYDSNNTGYYVDPASSGTSLNINGGISTTAASGSILLRHSVSEANAWLFMENAPNWGLFWFNTGTQSGQTIGSYTTIGAELFGTNNGVGGFNPNSAWTGTDANTRATWMLSNYTGYIWSNSTIFAAGDMRAPLFYDSNNTGYYVDAASGSRMNSITYDNLYFSGDTSYGFLGRNVYADTVNGRGSDPLELNYYDGGAVIIGAGGSKGLTAGTLTANGLIRVNGNTNLYLDYNYGQSIVGVYSSYRYQGVFAMGDAYKLAIDGTTAGNLYGIAWSHPNAGGVAGNLNTHGALFLENGTFLAAISGSIRSRDDMRAPIFYDSNNTGYYVDAASTTALYDLTIIGSAHKYLYINPGNGYEAMVRYNGGSGSGWYGGKRTSGGINSTADFHFYSEAAANDVFGISTGGTAIASGDMRTPIFYDSNDTGFYIDPNNTSKLSTLNVNNLNSGNVINVGYNNNGGESIATSSARGIELHNPGGRSYWIGKREGGWTQPMDVAFYTGIRYHAELSYNGHRFFVNGYDTTEAFSVGNGDTNVRVSNILFASGDARAPIFYDISDTGYYLNPNGVSYLYSLELAGGAYFRPRNWIQFDGNYGLYWPNNYGAHFYPNNGSSYTQLRLDGNKNGYGGIWDSYSAVAGIMYDTGGNGGVYREANSRWYFYYHLSNDCMGIGTSSTSSSYSLYLNKGVYAQSRIDATIFYDTNNTAYYLDPNGGSYFAGSVEVANGYFLTNGIGGSMYMTSVSGSFGGYLRTSGHMVLDQMNTGYNVYVLDGNSVGVVKNASSQSWSAFSDRTIKTVHSVMVDNLSKLESITPIYYSFNNFADDKNRIGLIAQEVQEQFPELVELEPRTEKLTLDYTGLIPVLLGAIKELKNKVEDLESRL